MSRKRMRDKEYHRNIAGKLVAGLSFEDKLTALTGASSELPSIGLPCFHVGGEAAHGVQARHDQNFDLGEPVCTTVFSNPIGMAASWDKELMYEIGEVTGIEARSLFNEGLNGSLCMWAPTVDMERDPRWGRNEEAYGEDPHLTSRMAGEYIRGMAGEDERYVRCGATLKHFYGNNVEEDRSSADSNISEKLKEEYYLRVYREIIEYADPLAVMSSYNLVNGVPSTFNPEIREKLKKWGLTHVTCDAGALTFSISRQHAANDEAEALAKAFLAGVDCFPDDREMINRAVKEAIERKLITEEVLNEALINRLTAYSMLGLMTDESPFGMDNYNRSKVDTAQSRALARRAAAESVVLLKYRETTMSDVQNLSAAQDLSDSHKPTGELFYTDTSNTGSFIVNGSDSILLLGPFADRCPIDWYSGVTSHQVTVKEGLENALANGKELGDRQVSSDKNDRNNDGYLLLSEALYPYVRIRLKICHSQTTKDNNASDHGYKNKDDYRQEKGEDCNYAGIRDNRLAPVSKEDAEIFRIMLWDEYHITIRSMSTGKLLTTRRPEQKVMNSEELADSFILYASADEAFSWFVHEAFELYDANGKTMEFRAEEALHFWENEEIDGFRNMDGSLSVAFETVKTPEELLVEAEHSLTGITDQALQGRQQVPEIKTTDITETMISTTAPTTEKSCPKVIACFGLHPMVNCKEERDRKSIELPPFQRALLRMIRKEYSDITLLLLANAPIAVVEENAAREITTILWSAFGSEELGNAMADILTGKVCPAGRLPQTWYAGDGQLGDKNDYDIEANHMTYFYMEEEPLYRFGYGLTVSKTEQIIEWVEEDIVDGSVRIYVQITNQGSVCTDDVIQIYKEPDCTDSSDSNSYHLYGETMPRGSYLAAFTRVKELKTGETRRICLVVLLKHE